MTFFYTGVCYYQLVQSLFCSTVCTVQERTNPQTADSVLEVFAQRFGCANLTVSAEVFCRCSWKE